MGRLRGPCAYPRIARHDIQALLSQTRKLWARRKGWMSQVGEFFCGKLRRNAAGTMDAHTKLASAAKALDQLAGLMARLKSCPSRSLRLDTAHCPSVLRHFRIDSLRPRDDP